MPGMRRFCPGSIIELLAMFYQTQLESGWHLLWLLALWNCVNKVRIGQLVGSFPPSLFWYVYVHEGLVLNLQSFLLLGKVNQWWCHTMMQDSLLLWFPFLRTYTCTCIHTLTDQKNLHLFFTSVHGSWLIPCVLLGNKSTKTKTACKKTLLQNLWCVYLALIWPL